ncbi:MAG TPA: hypothetical protein VHJ78_12655 [Actinomycetota bacterium]|nr:hypothetical protein [Actinomycetota bacterium]
MSIPVSLDELPDQITQFGEHPYLVTVAADSTPHATSIAVEWRGNVLVGGCGRRTAANISRNDKVALLWPAPPAGSYALIVDGLAGVQGRPEVGLTVAIQPFRAVLHVTTA